MSRARRPTYSADIEAGSAQTRGDFAQSSDQKPVQSLPQLPISSDSLAVGKDAARKNVPLPPPALRDRLLANSETTEVKVGAVRQTVEAIILAPGGGVMVVGWIDDRQCPLEAVIVSCLSWRVCFDAKSLVRVRRPDVEDAQRGSIHLFGYFGLISAPALSDISDLVQIEIYLADGGVVATEAVARPTTPTALRDIALGHLASSQFLGNPQIEGAWCLENGLGAQLVALNLAITKETVATRHIERFGSPRRQPKGSIIVCLYGRAEFLFVQNALFSGLPGADDYEFVFVSNSPELAEELTREARLAHLIYGVNQTVVLMNGNAGFGAANNVGVSAALSRRVLSVNPDVFPRQSDWALRHSELVAAFPNQQTKIFGVPLYYDDGSLMHGGMYFEIDSVVTVQPKIIEKRRLLRVEHFGKGAPAWSDTYTKSRPVPAVSGAFISSDREWFEQLGGFDEKYILGHYEDADLCLRSFEQGVPSWLHDLRLWHLEGKGSTRRPHHEGASLVNRWQFTKRWMPSVSAGILGPNPQHKSFAPPDRGSR